MPCVDFFKFYFYVKVAYQPPDRRTQIEQVDDLLEQLCEEVEIDSLRPDPVKDVEARLAHLKYGEGKRKVTQNVSFNFHVSINRR